MINIPIFESTRITSSEKGIKAQEIKLKENVTKGASTKTNVFEVDGNTVSFTNNFNASAKGCINPKTPTTLGPRRRCIAPIIFRSNNVKKATVIKTGTNIHKALTKNNKTTNKIDIRLFR